MLFKTLSCCFILILSCGSKETLAVFYNYFENNFTAKGIFLKFLSALTAKPPPRQKGSTPPLVLIDIFLKILIYLFHFMS